MLDYEILASKLKSGSLYANSDIVNALDAELVEAAIQGAESGLNRVLSEVSAESVIGEVSRDDRTSVLAEICDRNTGSNLTLAIDITVAVLVDGNLLNSSLEGD